MAFRKAKEWSMGRESDDVHSLVPRLRGAVESRALVKLALYGAGVDLGRLDSTPETRRLKLAVELLLRQVDAWGEEPPSDDQLALFWEHISEVRELARHTAPDRKLLRRAG
jgi:hypothetical protein